ncbi:hypothetical protein Y88_3836 [Novosphingobium nitrogenifigens DSM 19370]|uniref:Uncharacterized protein n=1 Tax=Novosphingobium nitrogenifigens DSM 19370 TaxID=983920 RepID=F1ZCY7_9SPHN|nr:DcaP family trimeric outer membrane transporter [Novosphingobium nitrogenifigens]EGD57526.1 hypothetical protein Y88_3836 [Novosphingobium nitrogenifigens DSM 19370]
MMLVGTILVGGGLPVEARAQEVDQAMVRALLDRVNRLEAEVARLRAAQGGAGASPAQTGAQPAVSAPTAPARVDLAVPAPAMAATTPGDSLEKGDSAVGVVLSPVAVASERATEPKGLLGFHSGNSRVVLSGYVKLLMTTARYSGGNDATGTLGRDVYVPQSIPVYNPASPTSSTRVTDIAAKQTRFWVDADTRIGHHVLKGYIEMDFQAAPGTPMALGQGTQRTTNAYDLAMRRAFVQFDRWTFGQDFTTFAEPTVMPESTDYLGAIDGLVFVRQPQVRYTMPLVRGVKLNLSVENPETASATLVPDSTTKTVSASLTENGEDHAPDFAVRVDYSGKVGQIYLAGLVRQLRVDNAGVGAAHVVDDRLGWGVSTAGKIVLGGGADWRFQATYGSGIGRYLGLNFGPDAVLTTQGRLAEVRNLGLYTSFHLPLTDKVRFNLLGSFQRIVYDRTLDRGTLGVGNYNAEAWSAAGNVFYSPVSNIDLGIEYRHGERWLVNSLNGAVDRFDFAAKYSF